MDNIQKQEINDRALQRIQKVLSQKHYSQKDVLEKSLQAGFPMSQSELSRILTGRIKMSLYQAAALAEVCGLSLDTLVYGESSRTIEVYNKKLLANSSQEAFGGWKGTYYTIFASTAKEEDKMLHGELQLKRSKNKECCDATYKLNTGEQDRKGKDIYKLYQGIAIISQPMQALYLILAEEGTGELCFMALHYRAFQIKDVACRMGLVLTVSAGNDKCPLGHKMLLFRNKEWVQEEMINHISPLLKFQNQQIMIRKEELKNLSEYSGNPAAIELQHILQEETSEVIIGTSYRELVSKLMRKKYNTPEIAEAFSCLMKLSKNPRTYSIEEEDDEVLYNILRYFKIKESEESKNLHSEE